MITLLVVLGIAFVVGVLVGEVVGVTHYAGLTRAAFGLHSDVHVGKWLRIKAAKRKIEPGKSDKLPNEFIDCRISSGIQEQVSSDEQARL